jgi:hypothetical protein
VCFFFLAAAFHSSEASPIEQELFFNTLPEFQNEPQAEPSSILSEDSLISTKGPLKSTKQDSFSESFNAVTPKVVSGMPSELYQPGYQQLPVVNDVEVQRAALCNDGKECKYSFETNIDGGSLPPHVEVLIQGGKFNQQLHNMKGVFSVTPRSNLVDGSRAWDAKGVALFTANPTERRERKHSEKSAEFSKCEALAVQDKSGKLTAKLVRVNNQDCPPYASALLLSSIKEIGGAVTGHTASKQRFALRDTAYADAHNHVDDRRVDYLVQQGTNGGKQVFGAVHHRHFNAKAATPGDDFYDFSDHLNSEISSHHHSKIVSVLSPGNSLLQHSVESKYTVSPPRPEDADHYAEHQRHGTELGQYFSKDAALHVTFTLKKLGEVPAPVLAQLPLTTAQFVEQAKAEGFQPGSSHLPSPTTQKKKPNLFASMSPSQQVQHFKTLVSEIPDLPFKLAKDKCMQMLEVPAGLKILMTHLKKTRSEFHEKSSGVLLNALGSLRPMPTETLMEIVNDPSVSIVPREQALLTFVQPDCHTDRLNINVLKWLHTLSAPAIKNQPFGLHTTALHIKHGLVAQTLKCAKGAQAALMPELLELIEPTEQALQRSLASQDWDHVESQLIALGNSRLARHTPFVKQVMDQHTQMPEISKKIVEETIQKLNGVAAKSLVPQAKQMLQFLQTTTVAKEPETEKAAGFKYKWEWKFPADAKKEDALGNPLPKKEQGSDPTFQAIPSIELGANTDDGLYVTLDFSVKLWKPENTYSVVEFKINSKPSVTKKPALAKPTVTLSLAGIQVYTNGDSPNGKKEKGVVVKEADDDAQSSSELGSEDNIGYCQTDIKSLLGAAVTWSATATFFQAPDIHLFLGPADVVISFKIEGSIGIGAGVGALGGGSKQLVEYQMFDKEAKNTKNVQCGDGSDFKKGLFAFLKPEASIAVDGSAGLNCVLFTVGVGLNIKLIEIAIPAGVDIKIGGSDATCFGMQFKATAFSGRGYVFFDSWFTGRKEWDIFEWEGPGWSYPSGKQLLGGCNAAAGIPEYEPPKEPAPSDVDCQVGFYPAHSFGGDVNYRYYVASPNQKEYNSAPATCGADKKGKCGMKTLPSQVEGEVMSVKAFGNCRSVEMVDNDNGVLDKHGMGVGSYRWENGMIWYDQGGIPVLPWDLQSDVRGVFIRALPPRGYVCQKYIDDDENKDCLVGKIVKKEDLPQEWVTTPWTDGKPELKWHSTCMVFTYRHPDFIGFIYEMQTDDQGSFTKKLDVESIQLSPGCKMVKLHDDDWSGSQDNMEIYGSLALLDYDLRADIKQYDLFAYGMKYAKPDPNNQCQIEIFCGANYASPRQTIWSDKPAYKGEYFYHAANSAARNCVRSIKVHEGCEKVLLIDDDSGGCNPYIYKNHPDLNYFHTYASGCADSSSDDLEDDISGYYLFPKYVDEVASQLKKQQALVDNNKLTPNVNPEITQGLNDPKLAPKTQAPAQGQCWMCETVDMEGPGGYTDENCWRGTKQQGEAKCGKLKKTVSDINCRCNNWMDQDAKTKQEDEAYKKEVAAMTTMKKGRATFQPEDFEGPVNSRL